jgi:hypothetical protein
MFLISRGGSGGESESPGKSAGVDVETVRASVRSTWSEEQGREERCVSEARVGVDVEEDVEAVG